MPTYYRRFIKLHYYRHSKAIPKFNQHSQVTEKQWTLAHNWLEANLKQIGMQDVDIDEQGFTLWRGLTKQY